MNRWSIRLLAVGFALASFGVGAADLPIAPLSSGGSGLTNAPSLARGGASLAANPKVAPSDKGFGATWFDDEGGTSRIRFAAIDTNGAIAVASLPVSDDGDGGGDDLTC